MKINKDNLVDCIMDYEQGEMSSEDTLLFFSYLVKTGMVNQLQGSYGRTAQKLKEYEYLDKSGNILKDLE